MQKKEKKKKKSDFANLLNAYGTKNDQVELRISMHHHKFNYVLFSAHLSFCT